MIRAAHTCRHNGLAAFAESFLKVSAIVITSGVFALAAAEVREVRALVTAYTADIAGGGTGTWLTATGASVHRHPLGVAADPQLLPYGAQVLVADYPDRGDYAWHQVDDTGAAMRRSGARGVLHLDLRMRTVAQARAWGARWITVHVYIPENP